LAVPSFCGAIAQTFIVLLSEFNGDVPVMNYYPDWDINLTTGAWRKFDPARNLALNKTATVSSAFPTHDATNVTAATTYQNYINSGWESAASDP